MKGSIFLEDQQQLTARRQLEGLTKPAACPGEEDHDQDQVDNGTYQAVDPDRGDARAGINVARRWRLTGWSLWW